MGSVGGGVWAFSPFQPSPPHSPHTPIPSPCPSYPRFSPPPSPAGVSLEVSGLKTNRLISLLLKVALVGLGKGLQAEGLYPSKRAPELVSTSPSQWQEGSNVPPGKARRMWESYGLSTQSCGCELPCGLGSECSLGQYVQLCMFLRACVCVCVCARARLRDCLLESETLCFSPPGRLFLTQYLLQSENILLAFPLHSSPLSCVLVSWLP